MSEQTWAEPIPEWIQRQMPDGRSIRVYCEERAVSMMLGPLIELVEASDISRAEIARRLGVTPPYVTQVLRGGTNVTCKTIGAFLWACGYVVDEMNIKPTGDDSQPVPTAQRVVEEQSEAPSFVPSSQSGNPGAGSPLHGNADDR